MAGRRLCDTRCQSFYTDTFEKEKSIRMKWFLKNQEKLLQQLEKMKPTSAEDLKLVLPDETQKQPSIPIIHLKGFPNWRPPRSDGSIDISIMKPVDPKVQAILYEKNIASYITADNYNKERMKEHPENRYYFPECTTWVYGWRLKDYAPVPASKVGIKSIIRTEFYHPNVSSLHRDPDWYQHCPNFVKKC